MTDPSSSSNSNLDALLEHGSWVRALARSLVTDGAAAEDVEQKAWLAAIEKSEQVRNPKSWLSGVVRNLAGMHWREQNARRRREEVVGERRWLKESQGAVSEQPDGLAERMETFRILAVALGRLQEPYGTALYLRFFEELTMREIAQRMSVPESTTKARITRGLEMLRMQLESSLGNDWRAQCLVFTVPLAKAPVATVTTAMTVLVMTLKTKLLIAAASIAVASLVYLQPWDSAEETSSSTDTISKIEGVLAGTTSKPLLVADAEEAHIVRSTIDYEGKRAGEAPDPEPTATLRFQVVEEGSEQPLPGIGMSVDVRGLGDQQGVTDGAGHWSVEIPISQSRVSMNLSLIQGRQNFRFTEDFEFSEGEKVERTIPVPLQYNYRCIIQTPDGVPYANSNIEVQNYVRETEFHSTTAYVTDSQGAIEFSYLEGRVNISPDAAPEGLYRFQARLDLKAENDGQFQTLTFYRARDLQLKVQNSNDEVVVGATIDIWFFTTAPVDFGSIAPVFSWPIPVLAPDSSGYSSVPLPVDGARVELIVKHPEYSVAITDIAATQSIATITLQDKQGLRGRVVNESGEAVVGAKVRGWSGRGLFDREPHGNSGWTSTTTTDRGGNFELLKFDPGAAAWMIIEKESFAYFGKKWVPQPSDALRAKGYGSKWPSLPTAPQDFVLESAVPLFGSLVDAGGEPIAGTWIEISGAPAFGQVTSWQTLSYYAGTYRQLTGTDGRFSFPGVAAGEYQLKARGVQPDTFATFHTGPDPITLTAGQLDPGLFIVEFLVLDAETLLPVSGVSFSIWEQFRPGVSGTKGIGESTDAQGRCRTKLTPRTNTHILTSAHGYLPVAFYTNTYPDGASEQRVLLRKSVTRSIQLLAEDDAPIIAEESPQSLGAAVMQPNGFMLVPFGRGTVVPAPAHGVGKFGNAGLRNSGLMNFTHFPAEGATIVVECGTEYGEHGEVHSGPTIDIQIPGGTDDVTITLTISQLRALGLRD